MKTNIRLLYLLVLLRFAIPYFLQSPVYEPHRDEFLYLAEGNHLAFGFMEVPPMLSLFAALTHTLGGGMFWIKFWPSLLGAATFFVSGKITLSLGGKSFALWLLFLGFLLSAFLRIFFLFQPNAPDIFFWTLSAYGLIKFTQNQNNKWLYVFGISAGLGMLSKYTIAFYLVSIVAGLLLTKQRSIFTNKHFWVACFVGLIIFLPNFLWQYQHHFPVIFHMQELRQTQLQYVSPFTFLIDQVMMFSPCFFVWIMGLLYVCFSRSESRFRFIGLAYVGVIVLLLLGHGKSYYALGAYPVLLAFGAYAIERFTSVKFKVLRYIMVVYAAALSFIFISVGLPVFAPEKLAAFYENWNIKNTGSLKWEDLENHSLPQDFADMLGWQEMTQKVATAYHLLTPQEQQQTLIFCNNYGMAGAINFYGKSYHLPEAYSDNASFLYWLPVGKKIENLILVTRSADELVRPYIRYFKTAVFTDSTTNKFAVEYNDKIMLAKGASDSFNVFFSQKIKADKEHMQ